jgi:tetratricopeptide (TPR) repeat protein
LTLAILSLQQGLSESESIFRESIVLFRQLGERTNLAVALAYIGFLGDIEASLESVTIARTLSNKWIQTYCLAWQSQALQLAGGDLQLARRSAAESAELAREIGSVWALARSIFCQGELAVALGQLDEAREYLQECLTLYAQSQDRHHENMARTELAHVERWQGNFIKALQLYKLALVGWQDLGLQAAVARQFECLAMIAATQQKTQYAARLSGAANKLRNQTGSQLRPNEKVEYNANLEAIHSQLGTQLFKSCLSEGQDMTTPEAIAYALALSESPAMEDQ